MKKRHLILVPIALATGVVIGKHLKPQNDSCCRHRLGGCSNNSQISKTDPVYLRETQTPGHGLTK
ncbi:hypothetical protein LCO01nite_14260 [Lapidilactobacillus concavus]|uniref:hypothetical protein n=1 Tax=Lapidilactobacillus concavus TaxID=287844 RepID=UPI000709AE3C|nr:hypothetical protein [Lapidilactobacillus concavus]GEL13877.1 hypothetical protein LCO01nite_14260 [Lapidilactobacillus concavus]